MEILTLITLIFIFILYNACSLSGDSQCEPLDSFADTMCPYTPCPGCKGWGCNSCEIHQKCKPWYPYRFLFRCHAARSHSRHRTRSKRWRANKASVNSLLKPDGSTLIRKQEAFGNIHGSQVSLRSWFRGYSRITGVAETDAKANKGRKSKFLVGVSFLILIILLAISSLSGAKMMQKEYCNQKDNASQSPANRSKCKESILRYLLPSKTKEDFIKQKSVNVSERKVEEIWSASSENYYEFGEHLIFSSDEQFLNNQVFEILTLQLLSIPRLVSYQNFPSALAPNSISFVLLAQAGFKYTGEGTRVSCEGCNSNLDISELTEDPRSQCYHNTGCEFSDDSEGSGQSSSRDAQASEESESIGATAAPTSPWTNSGTGSGGASGFSNPHNSKQTFNYAQQQHPTNLNQNCSGNSLSNDAMGGIDTDAERIYPGDHSTLFPSKYSGLADPSGAEASYKSWKDTASSGADSTPELERSSDSKQTSSETGSASSLASGADGSHIAAVGGDKPSPASAEDIGAAVSNSTYNHSSSVFVPGSRYRRDTDFSTRAFYGTEHFETEFSLECHASEKLRAGNCDKNPGHLSYWGPACISMETFPEFSACQGFYRFLRLAAELTVRVVVCYTSPERQHWLDSTGQSKKDKYRTGTGSAIREPLFDEDEAQIECDAEMTPPASPTEGKTRSKKGSNRIKGGLAKASLKVVRKCASSLKRRKYALYIETNRHIVFDDLEAAETHVEFFYDQPDRKSIHTFKVSHVMHDVALEGSNRSILVCMTSDFGFVQSLKDKRRELESLVQQFPSTVREDLLQHVFVIHHPHGAEKVFSFGKSVVRKYMLEKNLPSASSAASQPKLTKFADLKKIPSDVSSTRKVLVYTADTCRGSSGAPVITFTKTGSDQEGTPSLALNLWMHEGKETNGPLNVSIMEACTAADLAPAAPRPRPHPVTLTLPVPGPVVRMRNPTYYVYSSLRKRLESFNCVLPHTFVHSIDELARGGFFYAGYDDCVRCFYCGVGLKRWDPHDDMYEEHRRLRPDCHFLILQMRAMGAVRKYMTNAGASNHLVASSAGGNASEPQSQQAISPLSPNHSSLDAEKPKEFSPASYYSGLSLPPVPQQVVTAYPVTRIVYNNNDSDAQDMINTQLTPTEAPGTNSSTIGNASANPSSETETLDKSLTQFTMLQMENAILERPLTCKVCNSAPVKELYLPCGHLDSCTECTQNLDNCPTCCATIKATVKIYFT